MHLQFPDDLGRFITSMKDGNGDSPPWCAADCSPHQGPQPRGYNQGCHPPQEKNLARIIAGTSGDNDGSGDDQKTKCQGKAKTPKFGYRVMDDAWVKMRGEEYGDEYSKGRPKVEIAMNIQISTASALA
jgi:hypothetical protein